MTRSEERRVLHTLTTFHRSSGAAENTRITLNRLRRDAYRVFLAVPPHHPDEPDLSADVTRLNVRHLTRAVRPWRDLMALVSLFLLCRKWKFDIVHTHNSKDGILGRWAARLAGVPVVVHTIHNIPFRASKHSLMNRLFAALERLTAPLTDALLGVSQENVQEFLARGIGRPSQYRIVYSGLELANYRVDISQQQARQKLGLPVAGRIVGWCGRLNFQKDPLTFVRAARRVVDSAPNTTFVVCGDDPLGQDLTEGVQELANELQVSENIKFLGFRADLPIVFTAVDCVMHSSRYEGMGRTICEALMCNRAVAGTSVDGVREVIVSGERGGILVPPEDPKALAEATLTLLEDSALARRLAAEGRRWVEEHLSADRMVQDITDLYSQLLSSD